MSLTVAAYPAAVSAAPPPNLVIGIDFGTHASGFAVYKRNPAAAVTGASSGGAAACAAAALRVTRHDRWPDQPTPDCKTRSALLYRRDKVAAWGWSAWKRWSEMTSHERRTGPYTYLENFKLLLEDGAGEGVDTVCPLPAGVTRVQAVADYLGEMRKYIREHLRRSAGINFATDEVVWCLTVPAIWSDAAKARMREAAHRAGLTVRVDSRTLLLTLEPEAAALSAVVTDETALADGEVVLVLDCGGGTADATLHAVRGSGPAARLEEEAVGRGALAGGAHVDAAAWSYIRDLLGPTEWDAWKDAHPDEVAKLKSKWEISKRLFAGGGLVPEQVEQAVLVPQLTKLQHQHHGVMSLQLPIGLVDTIGGSAALRARVLTRALSSSTSSTRAWVSADMQLHIPAQVLERQIFDPVVDKITELLGDVMEEGTRRGTQQCSKVLLAGGFARSPYLQSCVEAVLPKGTVLVVPPDPGAAVVTGAVLFGARPTVVSARRARLSYGVNTARPWTSHDAIHAASFGCPQKSWHDEKDCYYALDTYNSFVKHGELVHVDQTVKHTFHPLYMTQTAVTFKLYSTTNNSARYTGESDMTKLADVTLDLPSGWSRNVALAEEYSIEAEMRFGATELSLVATDPRTKNAVATNVTWSADMA